MIEGEIVIDGQKVAFLENRTGSEPTYIFLPGWRSSKESFKNVLNNEQNSSFLAIDFPGFGKDKLKEVWDLNRYTDFAKKIIEQKTKGPIVLVGHSFGGRVILKLLKNKEFSDRIVRVVLIGVPVYKTETNKQKFAESINQIYKSVVKDSQDNSKSSIRTFFSRLFSSQDYRDLVDDQNLKETFKLVIGEDMSQYVSALNGIKTDLIWGEDDDTVPISTAQKVADETGTKLHIVKNAGHFPFVDNVDAFLQIWNGLKKSDA